MGPSPKRVVAGLMDGLEDVSIHGLYNRRKIEALDNLASFINCNRDELVLTHNTTEGINMMVWGLALKSGDEIIISEQEHVGNAGPWLHRANLEKLVIKTVPCGKNAEESLAFVKKAVTAKTKVIALPHIPCTNGQILPIKEICAFAKTKNIITCIDGAHPTGMLVLNVKDLGVDFYASCCHKWLLGAQGTGYLYINKEKLSKLRPKFFGAEGTSSFKTIGNKPTLIEKLEGAQIFQFGTQSGALAASITEAVQFQNNLGRSNIENYIKKCSKYLGEGLQEFKSHLNILSPLEDRSRSGIIAFQFIKRDNKKFYEKLAIEKIIIRYVGENDINSLRVSTHIYNTTAQIDELLIQIKKYIE
jgi:selenocysteine lyase/cysteine desulfurase